MITFLNSESQLEYQNHDSNLTRAGCARALQSYCNESYKCWTERQIDLISIRERGKSDKKLRLPSLSIQLSFRCSLLNRNGNENGNISWIHKSQNKAKPNSIRKLSFCFLLTSIFILIYFFSSETQQQKTETLHQ